VEIVAAVGLDLGDGSSAALERFLLDRMWLTIDWMMEWIDFARDNPERIFFTFYPELADGSIFRRISDYFQIAPVREIASELDKDRIREKKRKDWRLGLQPSTIEKVESLVQERMGSTSLLDRL
jgi:hypothetical protein